MTVMNTALRAKINATGTRGFLQWLAANQPAIYRRARPHIAKQAGRALSLAGFGLTDPATTAAETPAPKSWTDSLMNIVTAASQVYLTREQMNQQNKVLNLQLQRAQAGLPPLDIDLQRIGLQPPQVQVGVAGDTMKLVLLGVGGLGALYVLGKVLGKSRRR
jgi:hypothetical protein